MGNEKKEEGKMQIPSENAFQGADIHGQFDSMGSESIDMGRMTASCVELLHRHLNMSTQDTGRILGLSDDEVTLINRMGRRGSNRGGAIIRCKWGAGHFMTGTLGAALLPVRAR